MIDVVHRNAMNYLNDEKLIHCKNIKGLDLLTEVLLVDRKPIAKSSVSMPATYLDVYTEIRKLFGKLPEAQIYGLNPRHFSLSVEGGRCPDCEGGVQSLSMKFLSDARVKCETCQGDRFKPEVLQVQYKGLNLSQILNLSLEQAMEHFSSFSRITRKLQPALDLGSGLPEVGATKQFPFWRRVSAPKLVPILARKMAEGSVLIMDEPTTGLHFKDVELLLKQLRALTSKGVTLLVIEHNQSVIQAADWHLELGPEAAEGGGELVYQGLPKS